MQICRNSHEKLALGVQLSQAERLAMAQKVTENVKEARDKALLGCYDDSKVFYGGAIQGIQQLMKEEQDSDMSEKWKQVGSWLAKKTWGCSTGRFCRHWACSMTSWS